MRRTATREIPQSLASSRHLNNEAKLFSSSRHSSVIGDDRSKLFPYDLCRGKVNRIEAAELGAWAQRRSAVE
jgi:hypothetical protein